jgi:uncharacterized protein YbjT (DUF2867 family)
MSSTAGRNHEGGPILVTGGTGTLGRLVVPRLQASARCGCSADAVARPARASTS